MDIYETEEHLVIVVELPGAASENLRISVEGGRLRINGKRDSLADSSHTKCHQIEIDSGFFQKQIYIPFEVDKDSATSHYKDGLLKIVLPKVRQPLKKKLEISLK